MHIRRHRHQQCLHQRADLSQWQTEEGCSETTSRQSAMESLNLNNLASSLPHNNLAKAEMDITDNFKGALSALLQRNED